MASQHPGGAVAEAETKRERRRGAAGRAAALRRAPSDSDCSAETASLSADSGDRAPRNPPPSTRSGHSRGSRRRGSEWEVLEGLKDGQRYEKRPEVFNGYLHKKRKWPLKGWHKRFFVIDGGILVYARSPTDVARGRLHGSVDVGLSVISAKGRRRRIDIDADEFIYHLRAKTPEVFRTWLNVLKVHRLYRQHLLTFGTRESTPKVHPPLDDLPPTDASSRWSGSRSKAISTVSVEDICKIIAPQVPLRNPFPSTSFKKLNFSSNISSSQYFDTPANSVNNWMLDNVRRMFTSNFDRLENKPSNMFYTVNRVCSVNCIDANIRDGITASGETEVKENNNSQLLSPNSPFGSYLYRSESSLDTVEKIHSGYFRKERKSLFFDRISQGTAACYFFHQKSNALSNIMRKSKKSTNLVKYRNSIEEPTLGSCASQCTLLKKYRITSDRTIDDKEVFDDSDMFIKSNVSFNSGKCNNIETNISDHANENETLEDKLSTSSKYDRITEKVMISVFNHYIINHNYPKIINESNLEDCVKQIVRDLYNVNTSPHKVHPVRILFRSLLDYWLKNTTSKVFKNSVLNVKSVDKPSNHYFTKDVQLSSIFSGAEQKSTQFHGFSGLIEENIESDINICNNRKKQRLNNSEKNEKNFKKTVRSSCKENRVKDQQIQELEKILKNTIYLCNTPQRAHIKDKNNITRVFIKDNDIFSRKSLIVKADSYTCYNSSSSTAVPQIQETLSHHISDTSISLDEKRAKESLSAYLNVSEDESHKSGTYIRSSDDISNKSNSYQPSCEFVKELFQKKNSIHVIPSKESLGDKPDDFVDSGQLYLKDLLEKVVHDFDKSNKKNIKTERYKHINKGRSEYAKEQNLMYTALGRFFKEQMDTKFISEDHKKESVIFNLSNYGLEHLLMESDPANCKSMTITIKNREKTLLNESKPEKISFDFSKSPLIPKSSKPGFKASFSHHSNITLKNTLLNSNSFNFESDLKPYVTSSEDTFKDKSQVHRGTVDLVFNSSEYFQNEYSKKIEGTECLQSCYMMSAFRTPPVGTQKLKKNLYLTDDKDKSVESVVFSNSKNYCGQHHPAPKIIDEKFILVLLENLTLLSKNCPGLHKEINALYLKLKRKCDKQIKKSDRQGLGLLGNIYKDDQENKTLQKGIDCSQPIFTKKHKGIHSVTKYTDKSNNTDVEKISNFQLLSNSIHPVFVSCNKIDNYGNKEKIEWNKNDDNILKSIEKMGETDCFIFKIFCGCNMNRDENIFKNILKCSCKNLDTYKQKNIGQSLKIQKENLKLQQKVNKNVAHINSGTSVTTAYKYLKNIESVQNDFTKICTKYPNKNTKVQNENYQSDRDFIKIYPFAYLLSNNEKKKFIEAVASKFKQIEYKNTSSLKMQRECKNNLNYKNYYSVTRMYSNDELDLMNISCVSTSAVSRMSDEIKTIYRCKSDPYCCTGLASPTACTRGPQAGFVSGTPGGKFASWIVESGGPLENAARELGQAQLTVQQLQRLLDALELHQQVHHDTDVSVEGASPSVKKDRRKFGLRKKKSNSKCASVELMLPQHIDPSGSHMALSTLTAPPSPGGGASSMPNSSASLPMACAAARPQSLPGAEILGNSIGPTSISSLTPDHQLREDFSVLAKDLVASLKTIVATLICERGRLRTAMENSESTAASGGTVVAALRNNLTSALQQNSELRSRLSRIHDASDLAEVSSVGPNDAVARQFAQSLSYSSSCVSASEFFDAEEHDDDAKTPDIIPVTEGGVIELDGDSSSEVGSLSSEDGSASSDNSDAISTEPVTLRLTSNGTDHSGKALWSRRARLPCPRPTPEGPSLWNLLYKNIGKDLSQISMPVTINEPLNMLQRLCEELEYSELLDQASECKDSVERMALIAAFAVSAYASSGHRAASKPFNPLLSETYECIRDDKGFRFIAEQVSHHPPISACHAESSRWQMWQEARIKTKFWGKSMEFQPTGRVHVRLANGNHYSWNKVTTCVHNLFGGQRWVDQYGDMLITCHGATISCKLQFIKASSWSQTRHEIRGEIADTSTGARLRLSGRWSSALYAEPPARCLWRPGPMPPQHEIYYGFTHFAMELNEMEPGMREVLPRTDTRFRPDQRALEEGDVESAEHYKHELEQAQRERRKENPNHTPLWFRKSTEDGDEMWVFTGEYWKAREAGFNQETIPSLW